MNVFPGGGARVQRTARMPMGGWEEEPVAEEYELPPHAHKVWPVHNVDPSTWCFNLSSHHLRGRCPFDSFFFFPHAGHIMEKFPDLQVHRGKKSIYSLWRHWCVKTRFITWHVENISRWMNVFLITILIVAVQTNHVNVLNERFGLFCLSIAIIQILLAGRKRGKRVFYVKKLSEFECLFYSRMQV